jgi:hypothetical protein
MTPYDSVIYVFLSIAIITVGKFLIWGDSEEKQLQKIFGSLLILITALISGNPWAISIAVVVSGLVVATEDFMKFVTAVLRSNSDNVPQTITALLGATEQEVEENIEEKIEDIEDHQEEPLEATQPKLLESESEEKRPFSKNIERFEKIQSIVEILQANLGRSMETDTIKT